MQTRIPSLIAYFLIGFALYQGKVHAQNTAAPTGGAQSIGIDGSSSISARIGGVPPEIIESFTDRGQAAPTTHDLTVEEYQKIVAAFEVLTPLHESILQEHLRSISVAESLPANAQTVRVTHSGPEALFDIIINARILDETLSEFATRKERQLFDAENSPLSVSVVAGSMDAVAFVLAHEATHVVDMVLGLTPPPAPAGVQIPETDQKAFARGIWESALTPVNAYRGGLLDTIPLRTGGERLNIEDAQALYEDLERTPFVSVYASLIVIEDLAELVAWRQMTEEYDQPYRIEIRNDTGVVYSYEPMKSPLVRRRLEQLVIFDSPEI
jgi:hypothetical protein